ncbi:MAG: hypothetical protein RR620_08415 [Clostridium sp.]
MITNIELEKDSYIYKVGNKFLITLATEEDINNAVKEVKQNNWSKSVNGIRDVIDECIGFDACVRQSNHITTELLEKAKVIEIDFGI